MRSKIILFFSVCGLILFSSCWDKKEDKIAKKRIDRKIEESKKKYDEDYIRSKRATFVDRAKLRKERRAKALRDREERRKRMEEECPLTPQERKERWDKVDKEREERRAGSRREVREVDGRYPFRGRN